MPSQNNPKELPIWLTELLGRTSGHEDVEVECKRGKGGLPKDLWETLSAFANTKGGRIVLGIDEKSGFAVEGVPKVDARKKEFWDMLRNPEKVSRPVCTEDDVTVEPVDGKPLLVIRVPAAARRDRPVYINGNPYRGTYLRRHSGDYRCNEAEVKRLIREAASSTADSAILPSFSLDDLDRAALSNYRNRFQTRDPVSAWNGYDDWKFLRAVGGVARDRSKNQEGLTTAGLLMFGQPESIREIRSRHLIDYRQLPEHTDLQERWIERITWEEHLFGAFFRIYPRLTADLPMPFQLKDGVRMEEGPVHTALREALVNLLVHADYAETEPSLILRFPEGYLFRNPGSSRVPEDDMLVGNRSDPRNPTLARMFRMVGLAEEAGTGIPKIVQAWRELGFQLPEIHPGTDRYEFSLELRYAHLLSDEDREWLRSLGDAWSEGEQLALVIARHGEPLDNAKLRTITGMHSADATAVFSRLRDRGLLEKRGSGQGTRYRLAPDVTEEVEHHIPPESGEATEIPDSMWNEFWDLAEPVRASKRMPAEQRDPIMLALCSRAPLSLEQLAELLGRAESSVRTIVQDLIRSGKLQYLYPERLTHPEQRYVTKVVETKEIA